MNFQRLTAACHIPRSQCWSSTLPGPSLPVTRFHCAMGAWQVAVGACCCSAVASGLATPGSLWNLSGALANQRCFWQFFFFTFFKTCFPEMFHFFEIDVAVRGSYWGLLYLDVSWWWIITFFSGHDPSSSARQDGRSVAKGSFSSRVCHASEFFIFTCETGIAHYSTRLEQNRFVMQWTWSFTPFRGLELL
jgi:hypothetical protein